MQKVEVRFKHAPEASARCFFENEGFKHEVIAPGRFTVQNSDKPMELYCLTANGRQASTTMQPIKVKRRIQDFSTAYLTNLYDRAANTNYRYQNVVELDFEVESASIVQAPPPQTLVQHLQEEHQEHRNAQIDKANALLSRTTILAVPNPSDDLRRDPRSHVSTPIEAGDRGKAAKREIAVPKPYIFQEDDNDLVE